MNSTPLGGSAGALYAPDLLRTRKTEADMLEQYKQAGGLMDGSAWIESIRDQPGDKTAKP